MLQEGEEDWGALIQNHPKRNDIVQGQHDTSPHSTPPSTNTTDLMTTSSQPPPSWPAVQSIVWRELLEKVISFFMKQTPDQQSATVGQAPEEA